MAIASAFNTYVGGLSATKKALIGNLRAAVGPDGGKDPGGFRQACERAQQRLAELEEE